jgi:hypothetical protein
MKSFNASKRRSKWLKRGYSWSKPDLTNKKGIRKWKRRPDSKCKRS